ncbi:hypothetical protein P775_12125 [Puniceibacterium antarcticum]|uniref:Ca-activated chloride channel family protein n=1 Tax=Puniceibacterium antarcticum TaxID=1206336 RepID=A0A2G8RED4_9RHOB|nr:hypothetical protein [Puniceibacterium antarcticum]PIL19925.1 hypothetical protein P775_12125 [Puniceibacterium antarcticum]
MRRGILIILITATLTGAASGRDAWAKLFWWAGAPQIALPLISDPAARGAALYEIGRYAEADAVFDQVGRSATYDRALSLAMTGNYALSVAYFDAVLFANQYDADAQHNRNIVSQFVEPVIGEANGHGRIAAILKASGVNTNAFDPEKPDQNLLAQDPLDGVRRLDRAVDNRTVSATEDWLDTLADAPGAYLTGRLSAEMERRRQTGHAHKEEQSRW